MSPHRSSAFRRWRARLLWWAGIGLAILIWYWAALDSPSTHCRPGDDLARLPGADRRRRPGLDAVAHPLQSGHRTGAVLPHWHPDRLGPGNLDLAARAAGLLGTGPHAVPPIVLVVVGMIWLGPTAEVVILVVTLVTLPLLVASMRDAVLNVDGDLLEMATVFSSPARGPIRRVILPAVAPPVLSAPDGRRRAVREGHGHGRASEHPDGTWRRGPAGAHQSGDGRCLRLSAMMAALTLVLELCLLRPLRRRLMAWSSQPS